MDDGFEPGTLIAGKYRVQRKLGQGGMGAVYAADHEGLGRAVALKVLSVDPSSLVLARFRTEARILGQIDNDHVCRVFDSGELDDGVPYMVMELLEGEDLDQAMKRGQRFSIDEVLDLGLQACEALAEAHSRGVVHRDLKPANLFLARRPDGTTILKLLDFGVAKSRLAVEGLTATGSMVGSPRFMSPEQVESAKDVDGRSDIWSLALVMHELITGVATFAGNSIGEVFINVMQEDPTPLAEARPDAPPALDAVFARCFQKDRDERFPTVADLALALKPLLPARAATVERIVTRYQASGWTPDPASLEDPLLGTLVMASGALDPSQIVTGPAAPEQDEDGLAATVESAPRGLDSAVTLQSAPATLQSAPAAPAPAAPLPAAPTLAAGPALASPPFATPSAPATTTTVSGPKRPSRSPTTRGMAWLWLVLALVIGGIVLGIVLSAQSAPAADPPPAATSGR